MTQGVRITPAVITRVVEGDTCDLTLDLGYRCSFTTRVRMCMSDGRGIDAPESRGPTRTAGKAATKHLEQLIEQHCPDNKVLVKSFKDKRGRYGRYIASLETTNVKLCDLMVQDGHAIVKEY